MASSVPAEATPGPGPGGRWVTATTTVITSASLYATCDVHLLLLHVSLDLHLPSMSSQSLQSQLSQGLLVKHPEFWFSDGSLILCAQSTLFRVHISQLCRKSVFFRDLFSLPQPPQSDLDERQLEGCPVLDLHDSPEDVANLVKVIYDGPYVPSLSSFPSFLLFSRMYAFVHVRRPQIDDFARPSLRATGDLGGAQGVPPSFPVVSTDLLYASYRAIVQ